MELSASRALAGMACTRRAVVGAMAALAGGATLAQSTNWPSRLARFLVPGPPGGPADLYARLFAEHCARTFNSPFVVENRPGATGSIASQTLVRGPADGYTFLIGSNSTFVVTPLLQKNPGYDPARDYAPVGIFTSYPALILGRTNLPFRDLPSLIAHARQKPGTLNFATFGIGSVGHLTNEHLCQLAGVKVQHINYPGTAAVLQALARGEADYGADSYGNSKPLIDAGRLVPIAVTGARRDPRIPNLPTCAEAGFPQIDVRIWLGFVGVSGTPAPIIARLHTELVRFAELPDVKQRLESNFSDPQTESPAEMGERMARERRLWGDVIRDAKIVIE
jgi:tripartite-type tricarboxylate transporter receptor subunit TctC